MRPVTFLVLSAVATAAIALAVGSLVGSSVGSSSLAFNAPSPPDHDTYHVLITGWGPFLNFSFNPSMHLALHMKGRCTEERTENPWATFRVCWTGIVLPVNRTGVMVVEDMLKRGVRYDAILHTGLENVAKGLKLEVVAANFRANDTGGPSTHPAIKGSPFIEPTTAHLGRLAISRWVHDDPYHGPHHDLSRFDASRHLAAASGESAWAKTAVQADLASGELARWASPAAPSSWKDINVTDRWSRDAGEYYCNELLYRSVRFIRDRRVLNARGSLLPAIFMHLPNSSESTLGENAFIARSVASRLLLSLEDSARDANEKGMVRFAAGWFAAVGVIAVGLALSWGVALGSVCDFGLAGQGRALEDDYDDLDGGEGGRYGGRGGGSSGRRCGGCCSWLSQPWNNDAAPQDADDDADAEDDDLDEATAASSLGGDAYLLGGGASSSGGGRVRHAVSRGSARAWAVGGAGEGRGAGSLQRPDGRGASGRRGASLASAPADGSLLGDP